MREHDDSPFAPPAHSPDENLGTNSGASAHSSRSPEDAGSTERGDEAAPDDPGERLLRTMLSTVARVYSDAQLAALPMYQALPDAGARAVFRLAINDMSDAEREALLLRPTFAVVQDAARLTRTVARMLASSVPADAVKAHVIAMAPGQLLPPPELDELLGAADDVANLDALTAAALVPTPRLRWRDTPHLD